MEKVETNWFIRILIILLCIFIGGIVFFNFFFSFPSVQISGGLIVLVSFLVILVLSEAFDNFSIVRVFTLSRKVREEESKNQELKKENVDLRNQIISISTSINQKQVNSTFVMSDEFAKMLSVRRADEPERRQKQEEVEQENPTTTTTTTTRPPQETLRRHINLSKYEEIALPKFLTTEGLGQFPIVRDAKFTNLFQQIDPVSDYSPIFDGYIKTIDTEIFIEMKIKVASMLMMRERLYLMLSKINYYRSIKRVNAYLFLVLIARPEDRHNGAYIERLMKEFEPAIANGLLMVREVAITNEEQNQIINE